MKSRTRKRIFRFVAVLLLLAVIYSLFAPPVLLRLREPGLVNPDIAFLILNPLRNRGPENMADRFLTALKNGLAQDALTQLSIEEEHQSRLIEEEQEHPLKNWTLTNLEYKGNKVELTYIVSRSEPEIYGSGITLYLEKQNSRWLVRQMAAYY